jgi:deoxyribose-phosphate aldolase
MTLTTEEWTPRIQAKVAEVLADTSSTVPLSDALSITSADAKFARAIDHTLLKQDSTPAQIDELCDQAIRYKFKVHAPIQSCASPHILSSQSCCVNGANVKQVAKRLEGSESVPCAVIGFPLGAGTTAVKAL